MSKKTIRLYLILSVSIIVVMGIAFPLAAQETDGYDSGLSQHSQDNIEGAIESYTKALAIAPDNPEIFLNRGLARLKTQDYSGAINDTTRAIKLDPSNPRAFDARGMALYFTGDCPGAVQAFTQALALDPGSADTYVNQGAALFDQQKINPAIENYTRALTIAPDHINALRNLGLAWLEKNQWKKAVSDSSRAIALSQAENQDCADIFLTRGLARYGLKNYTNAMDDFQTALSMAPDNPAACNQMAWMLSVCPDPIFRCSKKALILAKKAIALAPGPDTLDTLSLAYAEAGEYGKAVAHQTQLIDLADQGRFTLAGEAKKKLAAFQAGIPWRVSSLAGEEEAPVR
jgi:tetratricopeptide (TPR) repeat protein